MFFWIHIEVGVCDLQVQIGLFRFLTQDVWTAALTSPELSWPRSPSGTLRLETNSERASGNRQGRCLHPQCGNRGTKHTHTSVVLPSGAAGEPVVVRPRPGPEEQQERHVQLLLLLRPQSPRHQPLQLHLHPAHLHHRHHHPLRLQVVRLQEVQKEIPRLQVQPRSRSQDSMNYSIMFLMGLICFLLLFVVAFVSLSARGEVRSSEKGRHTAGGKSDNYDEGCNRVH